MEKDEGPLHRPRVSILLPIQSPGEVDVEMVERIIRTLYEDERMREVLSAQPDPPALPYMTLSELGGLPASEGMPLLISEIGVLTVPSPAGGAETVEELIRQIAPDARVEAAGTYRAQNDLPPIGDK